MSTFIHLLIIVLLFSANFLSFYMGQWLYKHEANSKIIQCQEGRIGQKLTGEEIP